jgi:hypothetical protein
MNPAPHKFVNYLRAESVYTMGTPAGWSVQVRLGPQLAYGSSS